MPGDNEQNNSNKLKSAAEVIEEEKEYLKESNHPYDPDNIWGLAISGGGIRSASFGLGVMQALVAAPNRSILSDIDYLSTVSGGGYIGSSLTWFLHKGLPEGGEAGTDPANFPFGQIGQGERTDQKGNLLLNFIRRHGNYLRPNIWSSRFSQFGVVFRTIFISLLVYLSLLIVLMTVLNYLHIFNTYSLNDLFGHDLPIAPKFSILVWLAALILLALAAISVMFSVRTFLYIPIPFLKMTNRYVISDEIFLGKAWSVFLLLVFFASLIYATVFIQNVIPVIAASISSLTLGSVIGFFQKNKYFNLDDNIVSLPTFVLLIGAFALDYGLVLMAFILRNEFSNPLSLLTFVVCILFIAISVNLNYISLHRMYRNRLMEIFMADTDSIRMDQWITATQADGALLENMCSGKSKRPYLLINSNIVLTGSPTSKYRSRGGDNFLLSKLFSGSDATGYMATRGFMKKGGRGMTLPTAMAISGVLTNQNSRSSEKGLTWNSLVGSLLGILNLRLGYWADNPKNNKKLPSPPNFISPGMMDIGLARNLNENKRYIYLTDGGSFENLGIYELIRRRAKVIIVVDAGSDAQYEFADLGNAVEKIYVDFGVTIRFHSGYTTSELIPGSSTNDEFVTNKYQLAKRSFAIADIIYDRFHLHGTLVYIKPTLTACLPSNIYWYKSENSLFPNQAKPDWSIDEKQFEAYRELGYQSTWQLFNSSIGREILKIGDNK